MCRCVGPCEIHGKQTTQTQKTAEKTNLLSRSWLGVCKRSASVSSLPPEVQYNVVFVFCVWISKQTQKIKKL